MSFSENTVIYSVTNGNGRYPELAAAWARFLDRNNINNYIIYCIDKKSFDYLNERGVRCELVTKESQTKYKPFKAQKLKENERYGLIASHKLMIAKELLEQGKNAIYADTDAFFCRNPLPHIQELLETHDCLLSTVTHPSAYPRETRRKKGFTVCGGFFVLKASPHGINFINTMLDRLSNYSDEQCCINSYFSEYMTHRKKKGCAYSFLAGDLSVNLLTQAFVRRTHHPTTKNCVLHVTGPIGKSLRRASVVYRKLSEGPKQKQRRRRRRRQMQRQRRRQRRRQRQEEG
tara:strand:- start:22 stop:888 length:867 start_codon:yes stop_codon:yes gene_type:complete